MRREPNLMANQPDNLVVTRAQEPFSFHKKLIPQSSGCALRVKPGNDALTEENLRRDSDPKPQPFAMLQSQYDLIKWYVTNHLCDWDQKASFVGVPIFQVVALV